MIALAAYAVTALTGLGFAFGIHANADNITGVEEILLIITEYGLIAKVTSFSPFTAVQVKKSAVTESQTNSVYASVLGNGGSISNSGITTVEGDEITYNITANTGYQLDKVMLNGEALENVNKDTTSVTLKKADLQDDNTLEVTFVKSAAAESYEYRGIEIKTPKTRVLSSQDIANDFAGPESGNNVAVAVTASILVVVLAGSVLAIFIAVKKLVRHRKTKDK